MCYRCNVCEATVPPRQPRLVHLIVRMLNLPIPRTEIAAELSVCPDCHFQLDVAGQSLDELRRNKRHLSVPPTAPQLPAVVGAIPVIIGRWQKK